MDLGAGFAGRFVTIVDGVSWTVAWNGTAVHLFGHDVLSFMPAAPAPNPVRNRGSVFVSAGDVTAQPVTDGEVLWIPTTGRRVVAVDVRNPDAPAVVADPSLEAAVLPAAPTALAYQRSMLLVATADGQIRPFKAAGMSEGPGCETRPALALPRGLSATGLAVSGRWIFYTAAESASGPYTLGAARLSASFDGSPGNPANIESWDPVVPSPTPSSSYPLNSPVVVGDTLYVAQNLGLAAYDLTPVWTAPAEPTAANLPTLLGRAVSIEARTDQVRMVVDGPWAYLAGGTYRVFDLR
jgi:hypothetical protein